MSKFFVVLSLLILTTNARAELPVQIAFCDGLLRTAAQSPRAMVLAELREVREILGVTYPPRHQLDPSFDEANVNFDLAALRRRSILNDHHMRAVVRLDAVERTLTGADGERSVLAVRYRGDEIAPALGRMSARITEVNDAINARGSLVKLPLILTEFVSGFLCGAPIIAVTSASNLLASVMAAAVFAPSYLTVRHLVRREVIDNALSRGWPAQGRAIEDNLRTGGPAFAMVGGSLSLRLPSAREMVTAPGEAPTDARVKEWREIMNQQHSFTPGEPVERARVFFDSIFYTEPETDEPVWLLIARFFEQRTREEVITRGPNLRRRGADMFPIAGAADESVR